LWEEHRAAHPGLGASSYTYAEATWTQGLSDWIGSHTRIFAFIGGVTAMVVSDNLRSGITKACSGVGFCRNTRAKIG
jgi:transposase